MTPIFSLSVHPNLLSLLDKFTQASNTKEVCNTCRKLSTYIPIHLNWSLLIGAQLCSQDFLRSGLGSFFCFPTSWSVICEACCAIQSMCERALCMLQTKVKILSLLTSMLIQTYMLFFFFFFLWNTFQAPFQQFSEYSCQASKRTEKHYKRTIKFHMTCTLQYMLNLFERCVRNKLKFCFLVSENPSPLLQISETLLQIFLLCS